MNTFDKIKKACRPVRITVGTSLIAAGAVTGIAWFYLGLLPLAAGLANFCPLCLATKKCTI